MGEVAFTGNVRLRDQFQQVSDSSKRRPDRDFGKIVGQLIDDRRGKEK